MRITSAQLDAAARLRRGATALAARTRVERLGDLSLNQVAVLGRIVTHGPMTPGEVGAQLRMLPQSLTRTFAALEAAGYVRRTPDPGDRRQALLEATSAGRAAIRDEMRPRDRWLARAMAEVLKPEEVDTLVRAAELMITLAEHDANVALVERTAPPNRSAHSAPRSRVDPRS